MTTSQRRDKTALVLAGGGVSGTLYEIGALLALNAHLARPAATAFDIFVGTSAGAIVTALLANGISPETMHDVIDGRHPVVRAPEREEIFSVGPGDLLQASRILPGALASAWSGGLAGLDITTLLLGLSERLPAGVCDNAGLSAFIRRVILHLGGSDHFEDLHRSLSLIATDLLTGDRAVFAAGHPSGASISAAVGASTALPLLFKPVEIAGRPYVDGGLRGNASLDVAVEQGAGLVVCVNPMVPYHAPTADGALPPTWQMLRITTHAGLHYHLKHLRQRYPGVDFVLIEPRPDDAALLSVNPMQYPLARDIVGHSCATVAVDLAQRQAKLAPVFARHGLRALDGPSPAGAPPAGRAWQPTGRLHRALAELQAVVDESLALHAHHPNGAGKPPLR
jgi:predicted acylesterase/phospholipase RssA